MSNGIKRVDGTGAKALDRPRFEACRAGRNSL
jgi:hypothetical protein